MGSQAGAASVPKPETVSQRPAAQRGGVSAPPVLYPSGERKAVARPGSPEAGSPAQQKPMTGSYAAVKPAPKPEPEPRPEPRPEPVDLDAGELVASPGQPTHTAPSGLPPSDEWLGHVLLGYAPFGVACRPVLPEPQADSPAPKR